jgi:hypothetical protein
VSPGLNNSWRIEGINCFFVVTVSLCSTEQFLCVLHLEVLRIVEPEHWESARPRPQSCVNETKGCARSSRKLQPLPGLGHEVAPIVVDHNGLWPFVLVASLENFDLQGDSASYTLAQHIRTLVLASHMAASTEHSRKAQCTWCKSTLGRLGRLPTRAPPRRVRRYTSRDY